MWEPAAGGTINITKKTKSLLLHVKKRGNILVLFHSCGGTGGGKNLPFKYYYKEKTIKHTLPMVQIFDLYLRKPPLQTSISIEKMYSKA